MAPHEHDHVHLDEAHWEDRADHLQLEGEAFLSFVTEAAARIHSLRGQVASPVRVILDFGSGPGVGTCELARLFPSADVIAVDSSPAMLDRTRQRASAVGLADRVHTQLAELPNGLQGIGPVDVIWASMSLHHVGNEVAALRALRDALADDGVLAIAERAGATRVLPDGIDVGRPGLAERLERAEEGWFAAMRRGLSDFTPSEDLGSMLEAAGFTVAEEYVATAHLDARREPAARHIALRHLGRAPDQFAGRLAEDDLAALATLVDPEDPRSVMRRPDVAVAASRQIVIARPSGAR